MVDINSFMHGFYNKKGIWVWDYGEDTATKFSEEEQERLYALEDTSWWFRYRAEVITYIASRFLSDSSFVLDVGGGNGYTTLKMQEKGWCMFLMEPSYAACKNAKKRGLNHIICGTLEPENVKNDSVAQIMLLDVLEHIEDDVGFLKLIRQKLVCGGKLLITVPAFQMLWSSEDDAAGHYRRYTVKQVIRLADQANYHVCYAGYFFGFLVLQILLVRVGMEKIGLLKRTSERTEEENRKIGRKQFQERKGLIKLLLSLLEKRELRKLIKRRKVRWGSSMICVLEKR